LPLPRRGGILPAATRQAEEPVMPDPEQPSPEPAPDPAEPLSETDAELRRVLFDHEMERGMKVTRFRPTRRRSRIMPEGHQG
jgi:hypothetical protein